MRVALSLLGDRGESFLQNWEPSDWLGFTARFSYRTKTVKLGVRMVREIDRGVGARDSGRAPSTLEALRFLTSIALVLHETLHGIRPKGSPPPRWQDLHENYLTLHGRLLEEGFTHWVV